MLMLASLRSDSGRHDRNTWTISSEYAPTTYFGCGSLCAKDTRIPVTVIVASLADEMTSVESLKNAPNLPA